MKTRNVACSKNERKVTSMSSRKIKILSVDDDIYILRMVRRTLEPEGYQVTSADNGESALDAFDKDIPDLVLLDIRMPGMDGITVCRRIRELSDIPIIMVTAMSGDDEKVEGLEAGADDYITKPFSIKELVARVRAVLRRSRFPMSGPTLPFQSGELFIDFARQRVKIGKDELPLTAVEYSLLSYMAINADRVVAADAILTNVWGEDYLGETHLLQVTMARLRQKLNDDAKKPRYIFTRPGMGYMLVKQPPDRN
ncbi:MAG: response regulator transcription factor [Dehalococcoidia bacterium]|nr:response regulator transcription factor [Dehalococcoidia bacterium]MDZ4245808.1 response regulator transcription factor [Dehalococcoidia bacterium]